MRSKIGFFWINCLRKVVVLKKTYNMLIKSNLDTLRKHNNTMNVKNGAALSIVLIHITITIQHITKAHKLI